MASSNFGRNDMEMKGKDPVHDLFGGSMLTCEPIGETRNSKKSCGNPHDLSMAFTIAV